MSGLAEIGEPPAEARNMTQLRVIGDVHAQIDFALRRGAPTYLELIANCGHSVQLGDMGDGEAYAELEAQVDAQNHRFFPGNHDHYNCLPTHCLGDYGVATLGGVTFFFVRGAASTDKDKLLRVGRSRGRQLWFEEEELTDHQMSEAKELFGQVRPSIMITHEAPTRVARFVHHDTCRSKTTFGTSRTSEFLETLLEIHRPGLWLFGHYHRDWSYYEDDTRFCCVGELSFLDIDAKGTILRPAAG